MFEKTTEKEGVDNLPVPPKKVLETELKNIFIDCTYRLLVLSGVRQLHYSFLAPDQPGCNILSTTELRPRASFLACDPQS